MFLLGLVYVVLIAVLIAAGVGAVAVAIIAGGLFLVQYFTSDKIALSSMGARQVRFTFCKKDSTLDACAQRLSKLRPK